MIDTDALPDGYSWQFGNSRDNHDISHEVTAERDADEARIWYETGDLVIALKRRTVDSPWMLDGSCPGFSDEEEFYTLDGIVDRLDLPEAPE
jgi:hypothetical protein